MTKEKLIEKLRKMGCKQASKVTGIDYNQLVMFCNGLRNFSEKRLAEISEKLAK